MSQEFIELENQAPSIAIIEKALARKLNFSPICTRSSAV
jgi:hypothetical protein